MVAHAVSGGLRLVAGGLTKVASAAGRSFTSATAAAGVSAPHTSWQDGDGQPEAGPSRLPPRSVKSETRDAAVEDLISFPAHEPADTTPLSSSHRTEVRMRPADRKGKARMLNDNYESYQEFVLRTGRLPLQLMPTEYRGPRPLVVPTVSVLLARLKELGDQQRHTAWTGAFEQSTYTDAIQILKQHEVLGLRPSNRELRLLDDLLRLRLFDLVRCMSDFNLALEVYDTSLRSIDSRHYALSVLLERGLRDIRAAHFITPLYQRIIAFIQYLDTLTLHYTLASPRAMRFPPDLSQRVTCSELGRIRDKKLKYNCDLAQDLLLRVAFLLPHIRDHRSAQTAHALLHQIAARGHRSAPTRSDSMPLTSSGIDQRSLASRATRRALALSLRRANRKGALTFPLPFLATVVRAFLGTSRFRLSPFSRQAFDKSVLVPPAYTAALSPNDPRQRRSLPNHLASGRHRSWLDAKLGVECLDFLSMLFGRQQLKENDLDTVLMAAVRRQRVRVVESILDILKHQFWLGGQAAQQKQTIPATDASTVNFFLPRKRLYQDAVADAGASVDQSSQASTFTRYRAYRACLIIFQLHRSLRPSRASQQDSSDRISALIMRFQQHLQEIMQASRDTMTLGNSIAAAPRSSNTLADFVADSVGDDSMSNHAALWSAIRELEMSAMDPRGDTNKLLAKICINEAGEELTIGQATSMDLKDPLQLELRRWPQAHVSLMYGLARRGQLSGADAVFRALIRRSRNPSPDFEHIQLHPGILMGRWAAVRKSAEQLARSGHPRSSIVSFIAKRANEILVLIGADPVAVPQEPQVAASIPAVKEVQDREDTDHLVPSSRLLEELLGGITEWSVEPQEAIKLYSQFRERWPLLCCHTGLLNCYLQASVRLKQAAPENLRDVNTQISAALADFRGHLFAQHSELADLTSPKWRPPHVRTAADWSSIPVGDPVPSALNRHRPAMNFGPFEFLTYAQTIWTTLRSGLVQRQRIPREAYLLIDQMLLCLVWMRRLGLQPKAHLLRQIILPVRYVYEANGWEWPEGVQTKRRTSSSGVVYQTSDGMGPLSAWLAEWVQSPLPEISRANKGRGGSYTGRVSTRRQSLRS